MRRRTDAAAPLALVIAMACQPEDASLGGPRDAGGAPSTGGTAGFAGGLTGGSGGGGTAGTSGAGFGGSLAGAGGAGGGFAGAAGGGGFAGQAGAGGRPTTCDSGSVPTGITLHTTFEEAAATVTPRVGQGPGTFSTSPDNDFVRALVGRGIRLDDPEDFVRYPLNPMRPNLLLEQGSLDVCYQPNYSHEDGLDHGILSTPDFSNGGIRIRKAGASNNNAFQVIVISNGGTEFAELQVPSTEYSFSPGRWVRLTVTWDFAVAAGERNTFVYFDGVEARAPSPPLGPINLDTRPGELLIGNFGPPPTAWSASGIFDELYFYDRAIVPAP